MNKPRPIQKAVRQEAVAGTLAEIRRLMDKVNRKIKDSGGLKMRSEVDRCCAAAMQLVCRELQLTPRQIRSAARAEKQVVGRWAIMWLARKVGGLSDRKIGGYLGYNHTNICHGVRRMSDVIETQPVLAKKISAMRQELEDSLKDGG
jgi:chromosomal replication initiation ATPase DnaA